jgi:uncharacterized protein
MAPNLSPVNYWNIFLPMSSSSHAKKKTQPRPLIEPFDDCVLDELQDLLDQLALDFEPLDVSMLDGYLCGILVQPQTIAREQWLPHVTDIEQGRPLPAGASTQRLHALVWRRHAELEQAIAQRAWFDPWIFELEPLEAQELAALLKNRPADAAPLEVTEAVGPWASGFALAQDLFPGLMALEHDETLGPLAMLYQYLPSEVLEDDDVALISEVQSFAPASSLAEAVENLVAATLLLADAVGLPQQAHQ